MIFFATKPYRFNRQSMHKQVSRRVEKDRKFILQRKLIDMINDHGVNIIEIISLFKSAIHAK